MKPMSVRDNLLLAIGAFVGSLISSEYRWSEACMIVAIMFSVGILTDWVIGWRR